MKSLKKVAIQFSVFVLLSGPTFHACGSESAGLFKRVVTSKYTLSFFFFGLGVGIKRYLDQTTIEKLKTQIKDLKADSALTNKLLLKVLGRDKDNGVVPNQWSNLLTTVEAKEKLESGYKDKIEKMQKCFDDSIAQQENSLKNEWTKKLDEVTKEKDAMKAKVDAYSGSYATMIKEKTELQNKIEQQRKELERLQSKNKFPEIDMNT